MDITAESMGTLLTSPNNTVVSELEKINHALNGIEDSLFVIAIVLIVIAVKTFKKPKKKKFPGHASSTTARRVAKQLSTMRGKGGEFTIANPWCHAGVSPLTGSPLVVGIVEDIDDGWVLLRTKARNGSVRRLVRISEITKIEELVE